jgi:protein phosphatase 2C family protein 2/3
MEDAHTTLTSLEGEKHVSFFAVYDGHGGAYAAKYAGANVYLNVQETEEFKEGKYREALKKGFLITDEKLKAGMFWMF